MILYTSDWHITEKKPSKRIDDGFFDGQLKKVDAVVDLAISNKVDAVIHGGDVFDAPTLTDYGLLNALVFRLRKLHKAGIPCYVTFGSHDLFGYNLNSVKHTVVGTLLRAGLMKRLVGPIEIKEKVFYGIPALFNHSVESYGEIPKDAIVVTHNLLVPYSVPYTHILFRALQHTAPHLFLCAHYHKAFAIKDNGNMFINTGPLVRTDKSEAPHQPNVVLLQPSNLSERVSMRRISIPCEQNVFDLTETPDMTPNFIASLQTTQFNFCDLFDLTKQLAIQSKTPEHILTEAIARLNSAQESLYNG